MAIHKEDRRLYVPRDYDSQRDIPASLVNLRESEIEFLSSRGSLTHLEVEAANKYRRLFEISEIKSRSNSLSLIEYGCRIDQSKPQTMGDGRLDAMQQLNHIHRCVGQTHVPVLQKICGQGFSLREYADIHKTSSRKTSRLLREALHLAQVPLGLRHPGNTIRA